MRPFHVSRASPQSSLQHASIIVAQRSDEGDASDVTQGQGSTHMHALNGDCTKRQEQKVDGQVNNECHCQQKQVFVSGVELAVETVNNFTCLRRVSSCSNREAALTEGCRASDFCHNKLQTMLQTIETPLLHDKRRTNNPVLSNVHHTTQLSCTTTCCRMPSTGRIADRHPGKLARTCQERRCATRTIIYTKLWRILCLATPSKQHQQILSQDGAPLEHSRS